MLSIPTIAVSVSSGSGLDLGKLSAKSAQDRGGCLICTSKSENSAALGTLLEDEVGKMCTRL